MKKFIIIIFLFFSLLLQSCGYAPIYGKNQKVNFYIDKIVFEDGDKDISNFIKTNLSNYLVKNKGEAYTIIALIKYDKNSSSKDSSGTTEEYELSSEIIFEISSKKLKETLKIKEIFKMNNFSDEFKEREYERTIKQNMARIISSKLIIQLSKFNAS